MKDAMSEKTSRNIERRDKTDEWDARQPNPVPAIDREKQLREALIKIKWVKGVPKEAWDIADAALGDSHE